MWSEYIFQILIVIFFLMSLLSMPLYNPTIRDYIFVEFKFNRNKKNHIWISMLPFILGVIFCIGIPNIIVIWNFLGTTIYNFNGYMIPLLFKMNYQRSKSKSYWKFALGLVICISCMLFYIGYRVLKLLKYI